ncbi:serine hydrolase [Caulobacter sp. BK020]|uniref:serine hydrolase n=1 Tax=Caulobacter sp. BK020 TaxID=2512117 RepID=UPI001052DB04|nr:serine hydrolase [Caulobacter sp. BK020]TCS05927.1 CubicO group peptidase (beta-lactamase class C family) [Caulobacter sp. BK020]
MKLKIVLGAASLLAAAPPALAAAPACAVPDYARQARELIKPYLEAESFSGSILVAKDGAPVWRESFGAANREWDVANTADTKFRLGSITKQFTATAILQLAEQGKLAVDDPISKHYADAPPTWAKVTLKHLLTHTSGIPSYTGLPKFFETSSKQPLTPDGIIKLTRDMPLEFEPGTKYAYDNTGYILLGYVIEKVSGQAYADYVTEHIFAPLGMKDTGYDVSGVILHHRASGYQPSKDGWKNADYLDMTLPYAAGSLYSTTGDLLIWDRALADGKILTPASRQAMFTDYGHEYGFGWRIDTDGGHARVGHGGGINGFSTGIARYPKDGVVAIVLANYMGAPSNGMADNLAGLCVGTYQPPKAITLPTATLDRYVGDYVLSPTFTLTISRQGDQLISQGTNQGPVPIYPSAPGEFFARIVNARISFTQAGDAPASALVLHQGGKDRTAPRAAAK